MTNNITNKQITNKTDWNGGKIKPQTGAGMKFCRPTSSVKTHL